MVDDTAFYHYGQFGPYNAFSNKEMEILFDSLSMYLGYITCTVRSESDMMERAACELLYCEGTAA